MNANFESLNNGNAAILDNWAALSLLVPMATLVIFWLHKVLFSKIIVQIDRSCLSVLCPTFSQRKTLLKWASDRLPTTWSSNSIRTLAGGISEFWKDGSLLCILINSAVPGACSNPHRHWKKSPSHAQTIAYKYLGVSPKFTESDFNSDLTINHERNLIQFLLELQKSINKRSIDETNRKFSAQYVARGMGLYTGEQNREVIFYIYSNICMEKRDELLIYIRGPFGTKGTATIPPSANCKSNNNVKETLEQQMQQSNKIFPFITEEQKGFFNTVTSFIGTEVKVKSLDIPIQIDKEIGRFKITYVPPHSGIYEIFLFCDDKWIRGGPYCVRINRNFSIRPNGDSRKTEDKTTVTKKKTLCKTIDCINETICLDADKESLSISSTTKNNGEVFKTDIHYSIEENKEVKDNEDVSVKELSMKLNFSVNEPTIKHIENPLLNDKIVEKTKIRDQNVKNEETKEKKETENNEIKEIINNKTTEQLEIEEHKIRNIRLTDRIPEKIIEETGEKATREEVGTTVNRTHKDCKQVIDDIGKILTKKADKMKEHKTKNLIEEPTMAKLLKQIDLKKPTKCLKDLIINTREDIEKTLIHHQPKSLPDKKWSKLLESSTSPICTHQIVPEVQKSKLSTMSLSEKRKVLVRRKTFNSESENRNSGSSSLGSTASLPNLATSWNTHEDLFNAKRRYWESMTELNPEKNEHKEDTMKRSYDSILGSLSIEEKKEQMKKHKSLTSLEHSPMPTVKERKKMLLKNHIEEMEKCRRLELPRRHRSPTRVNIVALADEMKQHENEEDCTKETIKSQFKKAINYFKNLEESCRYNKKESLKTVKTSDTNEEEDNYFDAFTAKMQSKRPKSLRSYF